MTCKCGGEVVFEDTRGQRNAKWLRYEAFCRRCKTCDPNGYGTIRELKRAAPAYFAPKRTN